MRLRGWSWFAPPAAPDRITVATDAGDFAMFGLNLDNPAESLYPMIVDSPSTKRSAVSQEFRSLAIQADEYLLWLMTGGALRHVAVDLLHQRWRTLWPRANNPPEVTGIPLHEAALDRTAQRIFIATRAAERDQAQFTAVDAESGEVQWRRQLGVSPAHDPWACGDGALLADRTGRLLQLKPLGDGRLQCLTDATPPSPVGPAVEWIPESGSGADPAPTRGTLLALRSADRTRLSLRRLGGDRPLAAPWSEIMLPGVSLVGRPAIVGEHLVAPCSDGRLHRISLRGDEFQTINEQPYSWSQGQSLAPTDAPSITPVDSKRVVLISGREARWLELTDTESVGYW
jgi:hypothetical protein